jgi:hypothetical protein
VHVVAPTFAILGGTLAGLSLAVVLAPLPPQEQGR